MKRAKNPTAELLRNIVVHGLQQYRNTDCCGAEICTHALMYDLSSILHEEDQYVESLQSFSRILRRQVVRLKKKLDNAEAELETVKERATTKLDETDWSSYGPNILPFLAKKNSTEN